MELSVNIKLTHDEFQAYNLFKAVLCEAEDSGDVSDDEVVRRLVINALREYTDDGEGHE